MMKRKITLSTFMQEIIEQLQAEGRAGTAHVYRSTLHRIVDFTGEPSIAPDKITPLWLKAFQNHLLARGLQWNSISTYMRMLRAIYFRAVDCGLAQYRVRLFKGVYTGTRTTVKRAVDTSILQKLSDPLPEGSRELNQTRMLFLLLFMLRGIPFVDIVFLRKCDYNNGVISYRRRKTGTPIDVTVEPAAEKLSSYTARHSWATIAHYRNYQLGLISNAMGHSSERVTETYLKPYEKNEIDEMNKGVISYVFT